MPGMKFAYPRLHYIIRTVFLFALLASLMVFTLAYSDIGLLWPALIFILFLIFILITNVSPLFTTHELTENGVTLRNGVLFGRTFRFEQIARIERTRPSFRFGRIKLASGNAGLVTIKLKSRTRFNTFLFRTSDEILIDLVRPDEFVRLANQRLSQVGFPPVQPDGPGPELGYQT
jgi:hypothetical protein